MNVVADRFVGLFWGAYNTFKALKAVQNTTIGSVQLQFWSVYSALCLYDRYFEFLVSWFPLYFEAKLCLLLWLLWPESSAPPALFSRVLDPLVAFMRTHVAPRVAALVLR